MMSEPKITKITVGRLFNLGSYEHVRYELTVEVPEGSSATQAIIGVEKLMEGLKPEKCWCVSTQSELDREKFRLTELGDHLATLDEDEFRRRHEYFQGTPSEYIQRVAKTHTENVAKRAKAVNKAKLCRTKFDDLGGVAEWKDAKLDWEDDYNEDYDQ